MQYFEDTDIASKVNKIFVVTSARSYLNVVTSDSALVEPIPPKLRSHNSANANLFSNKITLKRA